VHLVRCTQCGKLRRPHEVCPDCGAYKGETVIEMKKKEKKEKK
jgi:large subunit ribosomal protein L32